MLKSTISISAKRNASGRILSINVPMVTTTDPEWYQSAAHRAGWRLGDTYRIDAPRLLTPASAQQKLAKSDKLSRSYKSFALHLAPHNMSGAQVCPNAQGCARLCVGFNGNGQLTNDAWSDNDNDAWLSTLTQHALNHHVHKARIAKTRLWFLNRPLLVETIGQALASADRKARKYGARALVRLNCTSDLPWERVAPELFSGFPRITFYDYTKLFGRARAYAIGKLPRNYHLIYSRDENNDAQCREILELGGRVAAVVRSREMIGLWGGPLAIAGKRAVRRAMTFGVPGYPGVRVFNGDRSDIRHRTPRGSLTVLYAKGRAARDASGFVIDLDGGAR